MLKCRDTITLIEEDGYLIEAGFGEGGQWGLVLGVRGKGGRKSYREKANSGQS